jgi:hypothetical protein
MNPPDASQGNSESKPRTDDCERDTQSSTQFPAYPWSNVYNQNSKHQPLHSHQAHQFQQYTLQNPYQFSTSYQMYPQQMTVSPWPGLAQNPTYIQHPGVMINNHLPGQNILGHHNSFQSIHQPQHDGSNPPETITANILSSEQHEKSAEPTISGEPSNINSANPNKKKRKKRSKGNKAAQKKRAKARRRQQGQETNTNSDDMEISDIEDEVDTKDISDTPKEQDIMPHTDHSLQVLSSYSGDLQELILPEAAPSVTTDKTSDENNISQKRDRLQLALSKIKLENAKAKLIAAQRQKEGALRSKLLKKLSSLNETAVSAGSTDIIDQSENDLCTEDDRTQSLPDVSALRMPSLIISNIGKAGPEENIRPRGADSLIVPMPKNVPRSEQNEKKLPISKADKLRLNLELAKRRLRLEELRHQKIKKSTSLQSPKEEIEVRNCVKNDQNNKTVQTKLSLDEMRRKHAELTERVNLSRQANSQRYAEKEVSDLRKLVEKQQQMLRYHVEQIKSITSALSENQQQVIIENAGIEDSTKSLASLQLRKASTLESIQSVTKKLMKLRRQRELLKVGH